MKAMAELFRSLDESASPGEQTEVLSLYLSSRPNDERLWALYFLSGHRLKRHMSTAQLKALAGEVSGIPPWLIDESYHAIGNVAETAALLLPRPEAESTRSVSDWMEFLGKLPGLEQPRREEMITRSWRELTLLERVFFNRILTGVFRPSISRNLICKSLASISGTDPAAIAHRIQGDWHPNTITFAQLTARRGRSDEISRSYPFFLAQSLAGPAKSLGNPSAWQAEWLWDGIRAQLIKRKGQLVIWSRNEDLLSDKLPELMRLKDALPDGTVIDGEILAHNGEMLLPSSRLHTRIARATLTAKVLNEIQILFVAFDIIESSGKDIRSLPLNHRRAILEGTLDVVEGGTLQLSPLVEFDNWVDLTRKKEHARRRGTTGVILKHKGSMYHSARTGSDWWKWKADPFSIDAVLMYAERAAGQPSDMYSLFTFAVWHNGILVPCAKTGSGLMDEEILEINAFVRSNTRERFGPVSTVAPELVFEIGFEGIEYSKQRKSGVALRNPRILHWKKDKKSGLAGTLAQLRGIVESLTPSYTGLLTQR